DGVFFARTKIPFPAPVAADILPPRAGPGPVFQRRPREITGPADGSSEKGERHPIQAGPAQARPEGQQAKEPDPAEEPTRLRPDRQGDRHADGGPEVRPRQDEPDPQPVQDLALEDDRRPVRAPARGTRRAAAQITRPSRRFSRPSWRS